MARVVEVPDRDIVGNRKRNTAVLIPDFEVLEDSVLDITDIKSGCVMSSRFATTDGIRGVTEGVTEK